MRAWVLAGGAGEVSWGGQRAVGLGGAGHGADVETGAARAGLVFLRGCDGREKALLWDHTHQYWKSLTFLSCLSPQCSL